LNPGKAVVVSLSGAATGSVEGAGEQDKQQVYRLTPRHTTYRAVCKLKRYAADSSSIPVPYLLVDFTL
jgi:hypothetical protein